MHGERTRTSGMFHLPGSTPTATSLGGFFFSPVGSFAMSFAGYDLVVIGSGFSASRSLSEPPAR
jgi:hypothetical protein